MQRFNVRVTSPHNEHGKKETDSEDHASNNNEHHDCHLVRGESQSTERVASSVHVSHRTINDDIQPSDSRLRGLTSVGDYYLFTIRETIN